MTETETAGHPPCDRCSEPAANHPHNECAAYLRECGCCGGRVAGADRLRLTERRHPSKDPGPVWICAFCYENVSTGIVGIYGVHSAEQLATWEAAGRLANHIERIVRGDWSPGWSG